MIPSSTDPEQAAVGAVQMVVATGFVIIPIDMGIEITAVQFQRIAAAPVIGPAETYMESIVPAICIVVVALTISIIQHMAGFIIQAACTK